MSRYNVAEWVPGPLVKTEPGSRVPSGVVCHSAVGYQGGLMSVLNGTRRASWHFSVLQDGTVWQHYDTLEVAWHAQGANATCVGIEHEGGYQPADEPLTPAQLAASVKLVRWLAQEHGFGLVRKQTLWEHNDWWQTSCPSGRIPWDAYTEEDTVSEKEAAELREQNAILTAGLREAHLFIKEMWQQLGNLVVNADKVLDPWEP